MRSTTLLRPLFFFFTAFLFRATIVIEGEGIGARSVRFPHHFLCLPDPLEKMMVSNSGPCVSECVHRYQGSTTLPYEISYGRVVEPWYRCTHSDTHGPEFETIIFSSGSGRHKKWCGNRTDLAPIPSPSITIVARKRKAVKKKKSGRSSVVLRTLSVLHLVLRRR